MRVSVGAAALVLIAIALAVVLVRGIIWRVFDSAPPAGRMIRGATFTVVGLAFFAHWVVADPGLEESATQSDWPYVLGFSAVLLTLVVALPLYGRMLRGRWAFRLSLIAAAGAAIQSVANIFEDGLQIDWVFFVFIVGTGIVLLALTALAFVVGRAGAPGYRLLAVVPAATVAATIFYVWAGGPIMLVTWLAAAGAALVMPARKRVDSESITP